MNLYEMTRRGVPFHVLQFHVGGQAPASLVTSYQFLSLYDKEHVRAG